MLNDQLWVIWLQPEKMRTKYQQMRDTNEHLLRNLEKGRQELDQLHIKKENLEEVPAYLWLFTHSLNFSFFLIIWHSLQELTYICLRCTKMTLLSYFGCYLLSIMLLFFSSIYLYPLLVLILSVTWKTYRKTILVQEPLLCSMSGLSHCALFAIGAVYVEHKARSSENIRSDQWTRE